MTTQTKPVEKPAEKPAVIGFVPEMQTVIVAGSPSCSQLTLNTLQELPLNIIVLNHAISNFQWQDDRVIWSVYDEPDKFNKELKSALRVRQTIVPAYKSEYWKAEYVVCFPNLNVTPIPYEYQNIMARSVERFQRQGTTFGHANCLCSALAFALQNSKENIYLYDAELPNQYILARKTIQFWAKDRSIYNQIFVMDRRSSLVGALQVRSLEELVKGFE